VRGAVSAAGRRMRVHAQRERRQHGDQVVEQVGLDGLVVDSRRRIGEAGQFERNACRERRSIGSRIGSPL